MESIAIIASMRSMLFGGYVLGLARRDRQAGAELEKAYLAGHVDGYSKAEQDLSIAEWKESR